MFLLFDRIKVDWIFKYWIKVDFQNLELLQISLLEHFYW